MNKFNLLLLSLFMFYALCVFAFCVCVSASVLLWIRIISLLILSLFSCEEFLCGAKGKTQYRVASMHDKYIFCYLSWRRSGFDVWRKEKRSIRMRRSTEQKQIMITLRTRCKTSAVAADAAVLYNKNNKQQTIRPRNQQTATTKTNLYTHTHGK